jgi:hypothetical protein
MTFRLEPGDLAATAIRREPMSSDASGATLERLTFPDGSVLVSKEFGPDRDWTMRATHDTGRAAELWLGGAMDGLPHVIDPAIVRIERHGDAYRLYLSDVSNAFLRRGTIVSIAEARRFLEAVAAMHAAFWHVEVPGLCSLQDLLGLVSPATVAREAGSGSQFLEAVRLGWAAFDDLVPREVGDAIHRILEDPEPIIRRLLAGGSTLVHADLHYGNVAPAPDRFYVIDWALAAAAPPAIDVAWYLDQSASFIGASREEVLDAFAAAEGPRHDPGTLQVALLAELALAGWQYGDATSAADGGVRDRRRADLDWWISKARDGLDLLG